MRSFTDRRGVSTVIGPVLFVAVGLLAAVLVLLTAFGILNLGAIADSADRWLAVRAGGTTL